MKEGIIILLITKQEAFDLRKIINPNAIKKSHSRYPHYYIVESNNNLKA